MMFLAPINSTTIILEYNRIFIDEQHCNVLINIHIMMHLYKMMHILCYKDLYPLNNVLECGELTYRANVTDR